MTSRTWFLLVLGALVFVAAANGCSSAPPDVDGTASSGEAVTGACTAAFTSLQCEESCSPPPGGSSGGIKQQIDRPEACVRACACVPVDMPAEPSGTGGLPSTATPIPPPSALATQGCTWGLAITGAQTTNVWACPALSLVVPPNLGAQPTCSVEQDGGPGDLPDGGCECEDVVANPGAAPNPFFGDAISGWTYVYELTNAACPVMILGTCKGGCAMPP